MAHVVGVPRRDPCQKCQLPVFLAERLLIGKQVYHRTCLKCARCGSQLSPGSFYETEVNNEYCCETCPDEEDEIEIREDTDTAPTTSAGAHGKPVRNSLSERLAFFEQSAVHNNGHKVLQKSVSDEEKRQHINEARSYQPPTTVYKGNAALGSFLHGIVDDKPVEDTKHDVPDTGIPISDEVEKKEIPSTPSSGRFRTETKISLEVSEEDKENISEQHDKPSVLATKCEEQLKEADADTVTENVEVTKQLLDDVSDQLGVLEAQQESREKEQLPPPPPEQAVVEQEVVMPSRTPSEEPNNVNMQEKLEIAADDVEERRTPSNIPIKIEDETLEESTSPAERKEKIVKESEEVEHHSDSVPLSPTTSVENRYPEYLNPFASDDSDDEPQSALAPPPAPAQAQHPGITSPDSLNPFDSEDDEVELEKAGSKGRQSSGSIKVPPPRPPPPRILRSEHENDADGQTAGLGSSRRSSLTLPATKKIPLPTPRTTISQSQTPTPEPTPRLSQRSNVRDMGSHYDSNSSLFSPVSPQQQIQRDADGRGSNNSLSSSAGGTVRSRKSRRAPVPPGALKELFPSSEENVNRSNSSLNSGDSELKSHSVVSSPKSSRKKRPAPTPPKPARLEVRNPPHVESQQQENINGNDSKNLLSYPLQGDLDSAKMPDEEKALLEGKPDTGQQSTRRLIPLHHSLLSDDETANPSNSADEQKQRNAVAETDIVYRRILMPPTINTPTHLDQPNEHNRQLEKLKDNKEAQNRNRQLQVFGLESHNSTTSASIYNKSTHGKWKRRKGPAPALPIPQRKVLQMLPLQEIRHELEIIEVQQQGLEKQGVILEKMIRDRCEGPTIVTTAATAVDAADSTPSPIATNPAEQGQNSKEVEDLILQLFELVNEKNELFRRQAELMYLRRQHRLEQEQADIEYEIRVLMSQPELNKTDTDKAREEALIARLVEVVELRNEVIDCLEMDRLREAEEDLSIKQRLELHNAKRGASNIPDKPKTGSAKLSKKEKKQQKESKKLSKMKNMDVDKDADESELKPTKEKTKKKHKLFF
ncbi:MICAL-like protein 1 isoform X2 [Scaptodrosophila lebanonensis]|nr:MICAL-like protein 1 isoform X2 [Scaptodrosophila lebanonensis]